MSPSLLTEALRIGMERNITGRCAGRSTLTVNVCPRNGAWAEPRAGMSLAEKRSVLSLMNARGVSPLLEVVSRRAFPPRLSMMKMSSEPRRSLAKAMREPSGVHTGAESWPLLLVSWRASPPATGTVKMSPLKVKATVLPSGEIAASRSQSGASAAAGMAAAATSVNANIFFMMYLG